MPRKIAPPHAESCSITSSEISKFDVTVWMSSSSSSASISFISFWASSSPSSVVVVGRQTSLVALALAQLRLQRRGHLVQIGIGTPDDVALLAAFHVLGPGLDRGHHHGVGIAHIRG
jgi:hypothetical protein